MTRIRADSNCHSARVPRDRESAHSRLTAAGSEAEVVGGFDGGQESAPGWLDRVLAPRESVTRLSDRRRSSQRAILCQNVKVHLHFATEAMIE